MMHRMRFHPAYPYIFRAAGRSVCGSINFTLLNLAQGIIRAGVAAAESGEPTALDAPGGIDAYNELRADDDAHTEELRNREEQGLTVMPDPMLLGALLKCVYSYVAEELHDHCAKIEMLTKPGVLMPDPWTVAETVQQTIGRQLIAAPREMTSRMKAEAAVLGVAPEEILAVIRRQQDTQVQFLKENKDRILEIIDQMVYHNPDDLEIVGIFDRLPAINRLRLMASADGGLYRASIRERNNYVISSNKNRLTAKSHLDEERREFRVEIEAFCKDPKVKRELAEAEDRGAALPQFFPVPPKIDEQALQAARKTA